MLISKKFHALKFAYVIQIVDRFGVLVFQRIKKISFPHLSRQKLSQINIKSLQQSNIPESSQQICRNWLLKIASIRQLIPRTIIQTTLIRLHFFINNGSKQRSGFQRLFKSNRCFGQYINCIFSSTFLIRIGKEVLPQDKNYIIEVLEDVFFYIKQGKAKFGRSDVSYDQFFNILEPFFITSFQNLAENLSKEKFKKFFGMVSAASPHYVILRNLVRAFSPSNLVVYSCQIVRLIQKTPEDEKYELYKQLLTQIRSMVFNQSGQFIILVWSDINQLKDVEVLLQILGPFSQIIFRNLPSYQKNKFYGLILDKFSGMFQNFSQRSINRGRIQKFERFLSQIIQRTEDLKDIVTLEPFLQLISHFPQKSKQQISYNIIRTFVGRELSIIKDPVVVHIMLTLIKNLSGYKVGKQGSHKQVQQLIMKFIDKVEFQGKELEELLSFYGQIRASFGYLQKVTTSLIYKAAGLTFKARNSLKGKVTNKLISFLQAAVAFCYITVPVIQRQSLKLKLYIYLCEVALTNNLISQATSFIKTCITELSEIQLRTDVQLYEVFFRIISYMIVIPDDPEKDHLFLFNGLFQAFQVSKFKSSHQDTLRFQFYTNCIRYLSCQAQQKLPFHIQGVTSNDGLFKSQEFKQALIQKIYEMFQKLEKTLQRIQNGTTTSQQTDFYISLNLPESAMTLIDVFDDSDRVQSLLTKTARVITQAKDRTLRKQNATNSLRAKRAVDGLNSKLKQNGFKNIRII